MDREDAKKVVKALQEKSFVCGANFIETDEYFITKKVSEQKLKELNNER